jgi:hypothetical protein
LLRHLIVDTIKSVIVWDEKKRLQNLEKHQLDFADAGWVFDNPDKITLPSPRGAESGYLDVAFVSEVGNDTRLRLRPAGGRDASNFISNCVMPGKEAL